MKNSAIKAMRAIQHRVDPSEVEVEFLCSVGNEYSYEVVIKGEKPSKSTVHVKVDNDE